MFHGLPSMEHYAAAKAALAAIIKGLAVELGPFGVRANMIAPGFIMSGFIEGAPREQVEVVVRHFSSATPLGRVGEISDIEGPAAYLWRLTPPNFTPAMFSSSTVGASLGRLDMILRRPCPLNLLD
jgi:NAD(P)-dependent dehydrogenase (short-subunit alcohol dehydrogenase family)